MLKALTYVLLLAAGIAHKLPDDASNKTANAMRSSNTTLSNATTLSNRTTPAPEMSAEEKLRELCANGPAELAALKVALDGNRRDDMGLRDMRDACNKSHSKFWDRAEKMACMRVGQLSLVTFCHGLFADCPEVTELLSHLDTDEEALAMRVSNLQATLVTCPVDGKLSEWSPCQPINGGAGGPGMQNRNCSNPKPLNGGAKCDGITQQTCFVADCESPNGEMRNKDSCACGKTVTCPSNEFCAASANICFAAELNSCKNAEGKNINGDPCYCGSSICAGGYTCTARSSKCALLDPCANNNGKSVNVESCRCGPINCVGGITCLLAQKSICGGSSAAVISVPFCQAQSKTLKCSSGKNVVVKSVQVKCCGDECGPKGSGDADTCSSEHLTKNDMATSDAKSLGKAKAGCDGKKSCVVSIWGTGTRIEQDDACRGPYKKATVEYSCTG